jgi:two-component system sensor histidine kinase PilS (NtrC family)
MRGAIQVLESSMPPESVQADLMTIILRESDRLNSIISNFLSYARPKAANFEQVDVCDAIRDTATLLKHGPDVNDKHNLTLRLPDKPVTIHADATQLKQIFWNVARNAFQAMPDGGDLKISLETIRNNRIRIVVEDNGHGMPPEQVEQLFEPFSNSTSGGTGLGLSIVYQIIRDHNGTINVRSSQGEGTVITVELPREASPRLREDGRQPSEDKAPIGQFLKVRPEETKVSS